MPLLFKSFLHPPTICPSKPIAFSSSPSISRSKQNVHTPTYSSHSLSGCGHMHNPSSYKFHRILAESTVFHAVEGVLYLFLSRNLGQLAYQAIRLIQMGTACWN